MYPLARTASYPFLYLWFHFRSFGFKFSSFRVESCVNRRQQRVFAERFEQIFHCAAVKSPHPRLLIAMSGDEDNRDGRVTRCQLPLKVDPTHAWHAHIKNQAIRIVQFIRIQELASRRETVRAHSNGSQQVVKRVPEKIVVIYN